MIFHEFAFHPIHKFIHRKCSSFFIAFVFFASLYSSSQSSLIPIASGTSSVTGIISLMILKQSANSSAGTPNSRATLFPSSYVTIKSTLPLSQIVTYNPRSQPDTDFAVDMFPYKKTGAFQMSGLTSQLPKKPGNTPLSGTYLSFLDIKTTVSTCPETVENIIMPFHAVRKLV